MGAAVPRPNASLTSGVALSRCSVLWAQHADFSLVRMLRTHAALGARRVVPIVLVRHPTSLFFSEFLYKRHCYWRQLGLPAPPPGTPRTLAQAIARLRAQPGQRTLLSRFLAGNSWCSCADSADGATPPRDGAALRRAALANAASYELVGVLERYNLTLQLLRHALGAGAGSAELAAAPIGRGANGPNGVANAIDTCVGKGVTIPRSHRPTAAQRAEVAALLREDIELYERLDRRLLRRYELHRAAARVAA